MPVDSQFLAMRKSVVTAALLAGFLSHSIAMDLGVQGQVWPVTEIDFRQLMLESAGKVDLKAVQDEVKSSADKYFDGMPRRRLPSAEQTHTTFIDPSITVANDIMVPVADPAGDYQWQVLFAKGTKVNPLEKYRPLTAMLYFDGSSEEQLKFVREALAANPMRIVPVEVAGANVKTLSKSFNRPIFYANEEMMARFKVTELPALLYPGSGDMSLFLGLTAFAAPYKQPELEAVWSSKISASATPVVPSTVSEAERAALRNILNPALKMGKQ